MSFDSYETSVEGGRPVEIYEFTAGTVSLYFTTSESDVTVGGQVYTAAAGMSRNSVVDGPEKRRYDFQVTAPTTNAAAKLFRGKLPGTRIRLQVRKFHRDDLPTPEVVELFDGYVLSASFKKGGKETIMTARTELGGAGLVVPRRKFHSMCNHVLYHPTTCGADDTDPAYRASALPVDSVSGNTLTVTTGIASFYPDGWMDGGYVEVIGDADYRLITTQVGNVLTLFYPFSSVPVSVNVFAGCGHTINICDSKFGLVPNYGGFNWVPSDNPYEVGL